MTNPDVFKSEWTFTRGLTLDLLNSLSEVELSEPPGSDIGPFWKQFRHVGTLREWGYFKGRFQDVYCHSLLRREWKV